MKLRHAAELAPVPATRILTVKEVANYLQVSRGTIFRLLKRHELPAFKIGTDWRFNVEQIDSWRAEREIRTPRRSN
jgi:excisionase family DNA binding protein